MQRYETLSRHTIRLSPNTYTVEKVVVGNAAKEATINYLTKVVTPSTTAKEDFSLPEITENTKYVSVIIPQEDVTQLTIVIDGKNFV